MTQNLYLGADTTPIATATTPADLQTAVNNVAVAIAANNFPVRAAAIAGEIAIAGGPLVIGLQEAEIVSANGVTLNYADALIAALKAKGLNYTYAISGVGNAVHTGFTLDASKFGLGNFSLTDQEVVLVRTDVPDFKVTSISTPTFINNVTVTSALLGSLSLQRGYVKIDATLDGLPFELVSTHLDETHSAAEPAEMGEILTDLGSSNGPKIVLGDFNARITDLCGGVVCGPAELAAAGYIDTGPGLGFTCCQPPDLSNTTSQLSRRYDYIFESGFSAIDASFLVGDSPFENVRPVWPSDHAGVISALSIDVPEPASAPLLLTAMLLLVAVRNRAARLFAP